MPKFPSPFDPDVRSSGDSPGFKFEPILNTATGKKSATVRIFAPIGGWFGIDHHSFAKELDALDVDELTVRLDSPGGDAFAGIALMNSIRAHKATVTCVVDGMAASAASIVAMGADTIEMNTASQMMVHLPSAMAFGNRTVLSKMIERLDKMTNQVAGVYTDKAGGSIDYWTEAMTDETWYTAQEAVDAGLADKKVSKKVPVEEEKVSNWNLSTIYAYAGRDKAPAPNLDKEAKVPDELRKFKINGVESSDYDAVQAALDAGRVEVALNGNRVTDPTAIQNYVISLETFRDETHKAGRKTFVENLARDNKILASTVDALTTFALSLDDEHYASWQALYDNASVIPVLEKHGKSKQTSASTALESELDILQETLGVLSKSGLSKDALEKTHSFTRIAEIKTLIGKE